MNAPTVRDQDRAIRALVSLATAFPALPTDLFTIGTMVPPRHTSSVFGVRIDLHTTFADFEAWRTALGIDPDDVQHWALSNCQTLKAFGTFEGTDIELTAYVRYAEASGVAA